MLISENYKNVHSGNDHGISWEQSHINSSDKPILHLSPNQAMHSSLLLQNHHFKAQTLGNYTTRIETMFRHGYSASIQIQLKWKGMFTLVRTIPCFDMTCQLAFEFS